jgi:hypothetical protein
VQITSTRPVKAGHSHLQLASWSASFQTPVKESFAASFLVQSSLIVWSIEVCPGEAQPPEGNATGTTCAWLDGKKNALPRSAQVIMGDTMCSISCYAILLASFGSCMDRMHSNLICDKSPSSPRMFGGSIRVLLACRHWPFGFTNQGYLHASTPSSGVPSQKLVLAFCTVQMRMPRLEGNHFQAKSYQAKKPRLRLIGREQQKDPQGIA